MTSLLNQKPRGRWAEPSTYAGIAALTLALDKIFDINGAPVMAETIATQAHNLANGDWLAAGVGLLTGVLAIFLRESR